LQIRNASREVLADAAPDEARAGVVLLSRSSELRLEKKIRRGLAESQGTGTLNAYGFGPQNPAGEHSARGATTGLMKWRNAGSGDAGLEAASVHRAARLEAKLSLAASS
jgi:hypothetical protein